MWPLDESDLGEEGPVQPPLEADDLITGRWLWLWLWLSLFLSHLDLKHNHSQSDLKLVHQPLMTSHQITFLVLMTLNWVINYFIRYKVFVIKF